MNYVWTDGFRHLTSRGPNALVKGWTFSGTIFRHTGLPFTVVDQTRTLGLEASNYGPILGTQQVFADALGPNTALAVPELIQLLSDPAVGLRCLAAFALGNGRPRRLRRPARASCDHRGDGGRRRGHDDA